MSEDKKKKENGQIRKLSERETQSMYRIYDELRSLKAQHSDLRRNFRQAEAEVEARIDAALKKLEDRVNIYYADYEIPSGWSFDTKDMVFVAPKKSEALDKVPDIFKDQPKVDKDQTKVD